ncbi:MAG: hypothetical protein KDJ74_05795 [Notoacmeibacter sp.]|nr:hypothetical protein [Notoacmeibacter sp.]
MFAKTIITAAAASFLISAAAPALAMDGGTPREAFVTMHEPDRSSRTVKNDRDGQRVIIRRNAKGKVVKVKKLPRRSVSWARNETTGVTSIGIAPRTHLIIGIGPFGFSFSGH